MKLIPFLLFFFACTPQEIQIADDFIEGEAKTIETIINDASGIPPKH